MQTTLFRVNSLIYYMTMNLYIKLDSLHRIIESMTFLSILSLVSADSAISPEETSL